MEAPTADVNRQASAAGRLRFGHSRGAAFIAAAMALYFLFGLLLIAQKPGLQNDEAMMVAGAVHMQHSAAPFELDNTPDAWVCPFGRCIPLMAFRYIGSIKEFASLPFFAIFGPRVSIIRIISLLFGALAIWGIFVFIEPWYGRTAAGIAALALAINPAFLNMVIFDKDANGPLMAALGLTCAAVSFYGKRPSASAAFGLGAAAGFGIWCRANFVWMVIGGAVAAIVVFRKRILKRLLHTAVFAAGALVGGAPFLVYQFVSGGATWKAQEFLTQSQPVSALLPHRMFMLANTLLSDSEHRALWAGPPLPAWQLWLFPVAVLLACFVCLTWGWREDSRSRWLAPFVTLTFLVTAGLLFFSRLQVGEHHLVILLPLTVAVVVVACALLSSRLRAARSVSLILLAVYAVSAVWWEGASVRGLRQTGGIGIWSDAAIDLAGYLDSNLRDRPVKLLDWGFFYNTYVMTDARVRPVEIYSHSSEDLTDSGRPWMDEIRDGGVFVLSTPQNHQFPKGSVGFLRALAAAHPRLLRTHFIQQRNGAGYAQIFDIAPDSIRASAEPDSAEIQTPMNDPRFNTRLTGFYPPESGGFRWTQRVFSASFDLSNFSQTRDAGGPELRVRLEVPDNVIRQLGPVTLRTRTGGAWLKPETFSAPGDYLFRRSLADSWLTGETFQVDFILDKALQGSGSDARELGLVVRGISIEPEKNVNLR